jgi:histidinol-phosphate aminotransferase
VSTEGGSLPAPSPSLIGLDRVREPGYAHDGLIRLDRNERVQPLPEWFMETLREAFQSSLLISYPIPDELYRQLGAELGVAEEQLLLTPGSDAAIKALYQAYLRPEDAVVMLDPSYAMYEVYARMFRAKPRQVPFDATLNLDGERLLESVTSGVRLVMIANPNQPTGTLLGEDVLLRLAERAMAVQALLAVDETYYPFSRTTVLPWIRRLPNLLVIRSFSKAGLAGLRIGFVAGHGDLIANLYRVRSVHDVNSVAILCASQLLKHPSVVSDYVAEVEAGARLLTTRLGTMRLIPISTHTNFLLVRVAHRCRPKELVEGLYRRGYLVKGPFSSPCLADCIRVTLGPPALMASFAEALAQALAEIAQKREGE